MKEELYELANHIASAKGGLPQEWQDWAEEIEADIRKLANREAQPVGYIDPDSLKEYRGQRAGGTWSAVQRTTSGLNMTTPIYTAPPAPAVPQEISSAIRHLKDALVACNRFNYCADAVNRVEDACRAAMLAQPVSSGYKLVPVEATEDMIAAAMNCDDVSFNADETFCVNFGNIYAAMLAAAPEGENDHDTRR